MKQLEQKHPQSQVLQQTTVPCTNYCGFFISKCHELCFSRNRSAFFYRTDSCQVPKTQMALLEFWKAWRRLPSVHFAVLCKSAPVLCASFSSIITSYIYVKLPNYIFSRVGSLQHKRLQCYFKTQHCKITICGPKMSRF